VPEIRSNKLADGRDPVNLTTHLRQMLEVGFRFAYRGNSTWVNPAGVKVTMGYSGGEVRLRFYEPGQVGGPPAEIVTMTQVDHARRASEVLALWAQTYPTPIGIAS
jgi:hypothetical protein